MILLLHGQDSSRADTLRDMLYFIGIIARTERSASDIPYSDSAISAVLLTEAEKDGSLAEAEKCVKKDKIFCLGNSPDSKIKEIPKEAFASEIISIIRSAQESSGNRPTGEYIFGELDASVTRDGVYFGKKKISFTKTEIMILRSLIARHPVPLSQSELLNMAFRRARTPEISNIRTHVCVMNKKFLALTGKRLISSVALSEYSLIL